jgi:hypothetical protein
MSDHDETRAVPRRDRGPPRAHGADLLDAAAHAVRRGELRRQSIAAAPARDPRGPGGARRGFDRGCASQPGESIEACGARPADPGAHRRPSSWCGIRSSAGCRATPTARWSGSSCTGSHGEQLRFGREVRDLAALFALVAAAPSAGRAVSGRGGGAVEGGGDRGAAPPILVGGVVGVRRAPARRGPLPATPGRARAQEAAVLLAGVRRGLRSRSTLAAVADAAAGPVPTISLGCASWPASAWPPGTRRSRWSASSWPRGSDPAPLRAIVAGAAEAAAAARAKVRRRVLWGYLFGRWVNDAVDPRSEASFAAAMADVDRWEAAERDSAR